MRACYSTALEAPSNGVGYCCTGFAASSVSSSHVASKHVVMLSTKVDPGELARLSRTGRGNAGVADGLDPQAGAARGAGRGSGCRPARRHRPRSTRSSGSSDATTHPAPASRKTFPFRSLRA